MMAENVPDFANNGTSLVWKKIYMYIMHLAYTLAYTFIQSNF